MEHEPSITVEFNGITYSRNPDGEQRSHRVYYWAPRGKKPCNLHRAIWEFAHGPIPAGCHIHHGDRNPFNNDLDNLECITPAEHGQEHAEEFHDQRHAWIESIRPLAIEWHGSPDGIAWHREHGRRTWDGREYVQRNCDECGAEYTTPFIERSRYCSRTCINRAHDRAHKYDIKACCPMCSTEFWQDKYRLKPETCGRTCGAALRRLRRS